MICFIFLHTAKSCVYYRHPLTKALYHKIFECMLHFFVLVKIDLLLPTYLLFWWQILEVKYTSWSACATLKIHNSQLNGTFHFFPAIIWWLIYIKDILSHPLFLDHLYWKQVYYYIQLFLQMFIWKLNKPVILHFFIEWQYH